jgi:carboxyl-terminal processing protease
LAWLLGITAATLTGLSLAFSAPERNGPLQKRHENLRLLVETIEEVKDKYVKELSDEDMRSFVENMVELSLEHLDPYSGYFNPKEFQDFKKQSRGKFGGVGIRIGQDSRSSQVFVESPMVGTPAYEAGILAGDIILKVDGKSIETMPLKKIVEMIQGDPGEKVTLTVLHEGTKKPVDVEIVRAEIRVDSVLGDRRMENNLKEWDFWIDPATKIAYIRLVAFTETTVADLTKVVEKLQREGMKGLVVDLRNNPGGLLRAAVEVSSLFLPDGKKVVSTKGRNQKEEVYTSHAVEGIQPTGYPVAILINRWSASASEIVAAALQDYLRAVIIGERSYGKGSVQNIIPMENGASALKLTTASYWRPSGKNIHRFTNSKPTDEWGVKPSDGFEVKLSDEERIQYFKDRRERDVIRRPGQEAKKPKEGEKKSGPFKDRVLDKALEYIRDSLKKNDKRGAQVPPLPRPAVPQVNPAESFEGAALSPSRRAGFRRTGSAFDATA